VIFEMHVHTKESSDCGHILGADVVKYYKMAGYDGLVVTDHMCPDYVTRHSELSWKQLCERQNKGYIEASKAAKEYNMIVLYGCELRFRGSDNDYLCYGLPINFLAENEDIFDWGVKRFCEYAAQNNILVFQAHPMRNGMLIIDPSYLYGVEVFNGKPREDNLSRNAIVNMWAERFGLHKLAGSDCHSEEELARAGVRFIHSVSDTESLINELRSDNYMLLESVGTLPSSLSNYNC